ncbi:MAG: DUF4143 domain-containing protein [Betaproteobacteria bacterium]|nr:DUF4143 domain-containing protein [Betaproteobacteria bacterium]
MVSFRSASTQALKLDGLSADCGISHGTARAWLSVLEASYIVFRLLPHFENLGKRLVKSPKLYFHDTGLAAFLMGVRDPRHMAIHPARPALFETFVVGEFFKQRFNAGERPNLFYWRDNTGTEVDVLVDQGQELFPIEIKSGQTFQDEFLKNLRLFRKYAGPRAPGAGLVYGGRRELCALRCNGAVVARYLTRTGRAAIIHQDIHATPGIRCGCPHGLPSRFTTCSRSFRCWLASWSCGCYCRRGRRCVFSTTPTNVRCIAVPCREPGESPLCSGFSPVLFGSRDMACRSRARSRSRVSP